MYENVTIMEVLRAHGEDAYVVGEIVKSEDGVELI